MLVKLLGTLACAAMLPEASGADAFPSRPIRLLVGFPPGGVPDLVARQVARAMTDQYKVAVVVDNRPGAGGELAADILANSPPDGYTLMLCDTTIWAIDPHLFTKLAYDPMKDLVPVARIATSFSTLVMSTSIPAKNLTEFIAYLKQNPGKIYYASNGVGSMSHLTAELFRTTAGVDVVHVPYKGAGPVVAALLSGEVQMGFVGYAAARQGVAAGKLRILGVGSAKRAEMFPDIPTLSEGLPGFEMQITHGILGPAGIPAATLAWLNAALTAAATSPETVRALESNAITPAPTSPAQFRAIMVSEYEKFGRLVKQSGAHID